MKKVCLIIHSLCIGGMERVMTLIANNFTEREDTEVHLVLIGRKREIVYEISDRIIVHKPCFEFNNAWRTINTFRTIFFLRSKVIEISPDTVLSFGEEWNNLVLLSLFRTEYSVFIADRSQPGKDLGRLNNYLRRKLYPTAVGYIAQTKRAKNICLKNEWNNNVQVIGNPIREIKSNGQIEKKNIILSVGRLIKTKNFDQLICMFSEINNGDWKLIIVGGDAKKMKLSVDLQRLINEIGVEHSVILAGEQENIDRYYKKSKIFAFTSSSEGFPNVIGEALSAGLPVVSYDCTAGPSEMIEDGKNGFLIPEFNQTKFKKKLSQLMLDRKLRKNMSKGTKSSIYRFNTNIIANKFYSFINEDG